MELYMQEPKYKFRMDQVINRASGEAIPQEEPVMIFRGRDAHALSMIIHYHGLIQDPEHQEAVRRRIEDFAHFKNEYPERMKEPDTDLSKLI
jgi:hypothetical protein